MLLRIAARLAASSDYLYHVTWYRSLEGLAEDGLQPRSGGLGIGAYEGHSSGRVFLTGPGSVRHWFSRVEDHAQGRSDNVLEDGYIPVVLRVPEPEDISDDDVAQSETIAASESYYVEDGFEPDRIEVWNGSAWIPVQDWDSIDPSDGVDIETDEDGGEDLHYLKDPSPFLPPV